MTSRPAAGGQPRQFVAVPSIAASYQRAEIAAFEAVLQDHCKPIAKHPMGIELTCPVLAAGVPDQLVGMASPLSRAGMYAAAWVSSPAGADGCMTGTPGPT